MARLTRLSHTLNRREGGGGIRVMPPVQAWISLKNEAKKNHNKNKKLQQQKSTNKISWWLQSLCLFFLLLLTSVRADVFPPRSCCFLNPLLRRRTASNTGTYSYTVVICASKLHHCQLAWQAPPFRFSLRDEKPAVDSWKCCCSAASLLRTLS